MKKKNGFISITIIYSFFIVFLLLMLALLASYSNKRYLNNKIDSGLPSEPPCRSGQYLNDCINNKERIELEDPNNSTFPSLTPEQIADGVDDDEVGFFKAADDYLKLTGNYSYYYRGDVDDNYVILGDYIWRIVRINGNRTIRLIYQGEYNESASDDESKVKGNDYIGAISKYNFSSYNSNECNIRKAILNVSNDISEKYVENNPDSIDCMSQCDSKVIGKLLCKIDCITDDWEKKLMTDINNLLEDKYKDECVNIDGVWGAHLLHNIGYMKNNEALLYRYDSKYDNQDNSKVKEIIDDWYSNKLNSYGQYLSKSTIFCGDKNRTKCADINDSGKFIKFLDNCSEQDSDTNEESFLEKLKNTTSDNFYKSERYYYSGWERIASDNSNAASLICSDTGEIATNDANRVLNLNRYNVNNDEYIGDGDFLLPGGGALSLIYRTGEADESDSAYYLKLGTKTLEKLKSENSIKLNYKDVSWDYQNRIINSKKFGSTMYRTVGFKTVDGYSSKVVTLEYLGNSDLTYPIALLSADEAVYAGLVYGKDSKSYLLDYSNVNNNYWTMTLAYTDYTSLETLTNQDGFMGARYFAFSKTGDSNGQLKEISDQKEGTGGYIRPVINLNSNIIYCSGDGTKENPYEIGNPVFNANGDLVGDTCS